MARNTYRIRRLRGMSQKELAAQVGVVSQQIQKYECGGCNVSASRLVDVASALRVQPADLLLSALPSEKAILDPVNTICKPAFVEIRNDLK